MRILHIIFNKTSIIGFTIGVVLGSLSVGYVGSKLVEKKYAGYENQTESVKWVLQNPGYADVIKKNHDTYMKAAEDAFKKSLEGQTEVSK